MSPLPRLTAGAPGVSQRRIGDVVRVVVGAGTVLGACLVARGDNPGRVQSNLFRLINELPGGAAAAFVGVTQLGALGAVPAVAGIALLGRRPRLARSLIVAGGVAWAAAKAIQLAAHIEPADVVLPHVVLRGATAAGGGFPAVHVAVAAALATVAGVYLSPSARRLAWLGVAAVGLARVYVGAHLPIDALGGFGVGWATGSAVVLALGARRGGPGADQVAAALDRLGVPVVLGATGLAPIGCGRSWRATADDGRELHVHLLGPGVAGDGWLERAVRLVAFRDAEDRATSGSGRERAEHEAYLALLAARAGVRTPDLACTTDLDEGASLVVRAWVPGRSPDELDSAAVGAGLLEDLWAQVDALHSAGVSHGGLRAESIIVDAAGRPWLIGLVGYASVPGDEARRRDRAELIVATATVVGSGRAVEAARRALGTGPLGDALDAIQPLVLSVPTRQALRKRPDLLEDVRAAVAEAASISAPLLQRPSGVAVRNLAPVAAGAIALYVLLPKVAHSGRAVAAVHGASWPWLGATVAAALGAYIMASVAIVAASQPPLALGRTFVVQLAAAFTNRLSPAGLGGMATNVSYLQRAGASRSSAVSSVGLTAVSGFIVHTAGLLVVIPLASAAGPTLPSPDTPDHLIVLFAAITVAVLASAVVVWKRRLWQRATTAACAALASLVAVLRSPGQAAAVLAGSCGVTVCYILALASSLHAFGVGLSPVRVTAVFLGASAVAAAAPTPGGLGALEAALVAGLTAAGAPAGPAIAAVIAYRVVTYWLPVLPGAMAFRVLRTRRLI